MQRTQLVSTHQILGSTMKVFTWLPAAEHREGVIFAVHGFRGDHHGLARIISHLPGYAVVVPDLPGFGASTPMAQASHDVPGYVRALAVLAEQLQLPASTHLLGHSFGSILASRLATGRDFASLLLINPISQLALESDEAFLATLASGFYELCTRLPAEVAEPLLRSTLFADAMSLVMTKSKDAQLRRYVREQHRAYFNGFHTRQVLAESYRASVSDTVGRYAPDLELPVLMIGGLLDELGSEQTQQQLAASFAQARLVMLPEVGHLVHYEKADRAAAEITSFLASLKRPQH